MLREILSISGKPGLYKQVSQGKNMIIVESLSDGKRMPTFLRDKVVSLGDIQIFTNTGEIALGEVFENISQKENAQPCSIANKADNATLRSYMLEVLPEYDQERVYPSDMRKIFSWYNILINKGVKEFVKKEEKEEMRTKNE
jgi:hypothetical protein